MMKAEVNETSHTKCLPQDKHLHAFLKGQKCWCLEGFQQERIPKLGSSNKEGLLLLQNSTVVGPEQDPLQMT